MKTINMETFNGEIKVGTDEDTDWIFVATTGYCGDDDVVKVNVKEVDGTKPLGPNERWIGSGEFIRRMGNSKVVHTVLKEFIKMGYAIKMEEPKNKRY